MHRRVLLTGASGFLGKEIDYKLKNFKIEVISLGRSDKSEICCDLSHEIPKITTSVDMVIHCAGLAHVENLTLAKSDQIWQTNVVGTKNLLKGLDKIKLNHFILISSVSVYGLTNGKNIEESAQLKAVDIYGQSKIQKEVVVQEWCKLNKIPFTILRLPLVVGNNPPGNLGKMIKAIKNGYYFNIDGGRAKKSMVLVEDVAHLIPNIKHEGVYNLTDGYHPSFQELSSSIQEKIGKGYIWNIKLYYILAIVHLLKYLPFNFPINSKTITKMTEDLTFCDKKARALLGWNPNLVLKEWKLNPDQ
jgi:nucleoside-diphosphate-sugar epimerase